MSIKILADDVVQKDTIASNLFLNLYFDHQKMTHYSSKEPFASLVALTSIQRDGDALNLFETRPLEDILADIAEGWNNTQRCIGKVRAGVLT